MPRKPRKQKRDPFEVQLNDEQRKELTERLCDEIQLAMDARVNLVGDDALIDSWWKKYEQGDRKITKNTPWPGAANLDSWLATEKIDAVCSRVVQTIFVEPIWIVEGWGEDASKVPYVEQFHQWKAEEERLQSYLSKVVKNSLIETIGVLEVAEKPSLRRIQERVQALIATNPETGRVIGDEKTGEPMVQTDERGMPVAAPFGTPPELIKEVTTERVVRARSGPQYRVLRLKDFVILPGHASDKADVWGFAKRFWKRVPDLEQAEKLGIYSNVKDLSNDDERSAQNNESNRMVQEGTIQVAPQKGPTAEKELFEMLFLDDLDGDGVPEWYVATLSLEKRVMLRLQVDDVGQARYLLFTPFPRTDSIYGYSLIGHKLETIIDEHTATRNMIADRSNLVLNAPIKRRVGSLWNPQAHPWGPLQVIDLHDLDDVQPVQIPDVPASMIRREMGVIDAAQRVSGLADANSGVNPGVERTLGENKMVSGSSLIRIEEIVKHLQESLEDLFQLRHEIWKRTIREHRDQLPMIQAALESRGAVLPNTLVQAEFLEGTFRGKPRGSVESADLNAQRADFNQLMTALTQMAQAVPAFGMMLGNPQVARAVLQQAMRIYKWENRSALEAGFQAAAEQIAQQQQMQQQMQQQEMQGAQEQRLMASIQQQAGGQPPAGKKSRQPSGAQAPQVNKPGRQPKGQEQ
jgi:hypothetical protein